MSRALKKLILEMLNENRVMTIATSRPDGWPQATIVGYVNDGFLLYTFVARASQKYANIQRDPRVSITIGRDSTHPLDIKALSIGAHAVEVGDAEEFNHAAELRLRRYPEYAALPPPVVSGPALSRIAQRPALGVVALLRIAPDVFSVLDYSRGFGHADLLTFSDSDLNRLLKTSRQRWDGHEENKPDG